LEAAAKWMNVATGNYAGTIGVETLTFHHVGQKDVDTEELAELPRMLEAAGCGSTSPE
jgi:hypothetical protein